MAAIVEVTPWRNRLLGRDATTVYLLAPDFSGWDALPALPAGNPVAVSEHAGHIVAVNDAGAVYRATLEAATGAWVWSEIAASPA